MLLDFFHKFLLLILTVATKAGVIYIFGKMLVVLAGRKRVKTPDGFNDLLLFVPIQATNAPCYYFVKGVAIAISQCEQCNILMGWIGRFLFFLQSFIS